MALKEFRSGAFENKYSSDALFGNKMYFICFSSAEKFLAIFSPVLNFSLVLSLVSRQEKDCSLGQQLRKILRSWMLDVKCSFSFARPKENEPKEKGVLRKRFQLRRNRSVPDNEGDFKMQWNVKFLRRQIKSPLFEPREVRGIGTELLFRKEFTNMSLSPFFILAASRFYSLTRNERIGLSFGRLSLSWANISQMGGGLCKNGYATKTDLGFQICQEVIPLKKVRIFSWFMEI